MQIKKEEERRSKKYYLIFVLFNFLLTLNDNRSGVIVRNFIKLLKLIRKKKDEEEAQTINSKLVMRVQVK